METTQILPMLKRKSLISIVYLIIVVAFIYAYFYFWQFHPNEYTRNALSPLSKLENTLWPFSGWIISITSIIYFIHFICGAFIYPIKYKKEFEMNIDSTEPEVEKNSTDFSVLRGLFISVVWAYIFYSAFSNALSTLALVIIICSWFLLHIALLYLTSTTNHFVLVQETIDVTIIMPEKYPPSAIGEHTYKNLYFYIPTSVDKAAWCDLYIRKYLEEIKAQSKKITELSEKLAES